MVSDQLKGRRILVVDDEPIICEIMREELGELGAEVSEVYSGEEALDLLKSGTIFDVLITDARMPGISGVELIRQYLASPSYSPKTRFFLCSGETAFMERDLGNLKIEAVLSKPFDMKVVLDAVVSSLNS